MTQVSDEKLFSSMMVVVEFNYGGAQVRHGIFEIPAGLHLYKGDYVVCENDVMLNELGQCITGAQLITPELLDVISPHFCTGKIKGVVNFC